MLLVEPDDDFRYVFAMLLEMMGHTVEVTSDAAEALGKVKVSVPDVVLAELGLADIGGFELARQLRLLPSADSVALVAITGYAQVNTETCALKAGFDYFLAKPVPMHRIAAVLQLAADRKGPKPKHWLH